MGAGGSNHEAETVALADDTAAAAGIVANEETTRQSGDAPESPAESPLEAKPLTQEPGEAQREPFEWPLPSSTAAAIAAGASNSFVSASPEGKCAKRCRQVCRIIAVLLAVSGFLLALAGIALPFLVPLRTWALHHRLQLAGGFLIVVGVVTHWLAASPPRSFISEAPAWDDTGAGDTSVRMQQHFSLNLWNDAARFGADTQALEWLLSGRDKHASGVPRCSNSFLAEDLFNEPELQKLVHEARKREAEQHVRRTDVAKKNVVEQCRVDLEGGMSLRRLRQKLEPRCFVLDFTDGETHGAGEAAATLRNVHSQIELLRDAVSFLLTICTPYDEVVLRVSSPGGLVGDYGLASAQVFRLRHAGVRLVACVDVVAASGGYMLACVSDHLVAAPFALLGSIGVVAGVPNIHRILQRHEVDYLQFTAGRFKRTVGILTKNTDEGIAKFQEDLNSVHTAFTSLVAEGRGSRIDGGADAAATGEVFLGREALSRGLVDEVATSDEYLRRRAADGLVVVTVSAIAHRRSWWHELFTPLFHSAQRVMSVVSHFGHGVGGAAMTAGTAACMGKAGIGREALKDANSSSSAGAAEWLLSAHVENCVPTSRMIV